MRRVLFGLVSFVMACGAVIDPKPYDRSCAAAADCTPVFFGEVCGTCTCPTGAINVSSTKKYEGDIAAARRLCGPRPAVACDCAMVTATCDAGTCDVVRN